MTTTTTDAADQPDHARELLDAIIDLVGVDYISVVDMLDCLATVGLALVRDPGTASTAYIEVIRAHLLSALFTPETTGEAE